MFSENLPFALIYKFYKKEIQITRTTSRVSSTRKVQGLNPKIINILFYLIVLFFFGSGFHNPNYLEI